MPSIKPRSLRFLGAFALFLAFSTLALAAGPANKPAPGSAKTSPVRNSLALPAAAETAVPGDEQAPRSRVVRCLPYATAT